MPRVARNHDVVIARWRYRCPRCRAVGWIRIDLENRKWLYYHQGHDEPLVIPRVEHNNQHDPWQHITEPIRGNCPEVLSHTGRLAAAVKVE